MYRNPDSFTMTNSLLSPELRKPNQGGKNLQNASTIEESCNQFSVFNSTQKNRSSQRSQNEPNVLQKKKLITLEQPLNIRNRANGVQRNQKKRLTDINVNEFEDEEEEDDNNDEQQKPRDKNKPLSLKEIGSVNEENGDQLAFQNNNSEDTEDLKKKQRDIIRDDSSVRSGESQFYSKKVNIFDIIINKREPSEMLYIKYTGCFSFLVLIVLTFILFLQFKTNLNFVWNNFRNLEIGPSILEQYSQVLRNYEMVVTSFLLACKAQKLIFDQDYRKVLAEEGFQRFDMFEANISKLQSDLHNQEELFDYFFNNQTELMFLHQRNQDVTSFLYLNVSRGQLDSYFTQIKYLYLQIRQSLLYLPSYLKLYYIAVEKYLDYGNCKIYKTLNNIFPQAFTYQNYNTYITSLIEISSISKDMANDRLKSTKQLLILSVILVEVISSIIVLVVFPVYYTIQERKEEILKLICTFNSEFISNQITRYRKAQHNKIFIQDDVDKLIAIQKQSSFAGVSSTNQVSMRFIHNSEKKKRTISETNNLNRFSLKLSFRTFCIFLILSLNPILNYFLMRGFFENFQYNIEEYSMVYLTKSYLSLNYLSTYFLMNFPFYDFQEENRQKIFKFIGYLKQDAQQRFQAFYEMDKDFQVDRYDIDEYKQLFLNTLNEDACQILQDNENGSFKFNVVVTPEKCSEILQGKLKKGVILAMKDIYEKFNSVQELFKNKFNDEYYGMYYLIWLQTNNIEDLDKSYYYLRDILDLLSLFIKQKSQDYFDYLTVVQLVLFIESLSVITIIFLVIGARFIRSLGSKIYKATFLFTLLPIDSLIENPYVFNYLSNERRRNKGK